MRMKRMIVWLNALIVIMLTSCSADERTVEDSFIGQPVNISVKLSDGDNATTRVASALTTGTAYLTGGANGMKAYTFDGTAFTSADPLLWTAASMTIYGYYANGGQTAVTSSRAYTVSNPSLASFLAGKATATYSQTEREPVDITLRQQLAYVYVVVRSDAGSVMDKPKLGNGMLYTSGVIDNSVFDANGYATGGQNQTGWTPSGSKTSVNMTLSASTATTSTLSNTYYAVIIPQRISDTTTPFFTITIGGYNIGFKLKAAQTFKAGSRYNLVVDRVTNTLHLESAVEVSDFVDSGSSQSVSDLDAN